MKSYGEGTFPDNKLSGNVEKLTGRLLEAGVLCNILIFDVKKIIRDLYSTIQKEQKQFMQFGGDIGLFYYLTGLSLFDECIYVTQSSSDIKKLEEVLYINEEAGSKSKIQIEVNKSEVLGDICFIFETYSILEHGIV